MSLLDWIVVAVVVVLVAAIGIGIAGFPEDGSF